MSFYPAENLTYDDVMARAKRSSEWRRSLMIEARPVAVGMPPIVPKAAPKPPPPKPELPKHAPVAVAPLAPPEPPPADPSPPVIERTPWGRPTIRAVIRASVKHFNTPAAILTGTRRDGEIPQQRQTMMYLISEATGYSLPAIGRATGRDHTTVLHALRKIRAQLDGGDPRTTGDVKSIMAVLGLPWPLKPEDLPPVPEAVATMRMRNTSRPYSKDELAVLIHHYATDPAERRPLHEIAKEFGRSVDGVKEKANKLGLSSGLHA